MSLKRFELGHGKICFGDTWTVKESMCSLIRAFAVYLQNRRILYNVANVLIYSIASYQIVRLHRLVRSAHIVDGLSYHLQT